MSENSDFGFAKFVPGFDFLQNLAKDASQGMTQMPGLSNWIAPTLNVDELDKRIAELKAVHFWLDQNGKALVATIQALEVQKMTLATLKGMNVRMADMAEALKVKPQPAGKGAGANPDAAAGSGKDKGSAKGAPAGGAAAANDPAAGSAIDPLQWWGSLTRQFQEIAANAMKDVAQQGGGEAAASAVADATAQAMKTAADVSQAATEMARAATPAKARAPASKAAARKSPPRKKSSPAR